MTSKLKIASFFCGCGGSDLGMLGDFNFLNNYYATLPYKVVYALDNNKYAIQTYNANFKHPAICKDIRDLNVKNIPNHDVLLGGFPCQSFSTLNPTKNTNDERANLYQEIAKILQAKQPRFFICENVKGLLTLQKGQILQKIITEFENAGYQIQHKILLASNFGIPQKRERIFIVGVRKDKKIKFNFPQETHEEHITSTTKKQWIPLKKVISHIPIKDQKYYFSERAVLGLKNSKNNMKRGLFQDLEGQCLTITSHLAKTSLNSRDPVLLVDKEKELYRRFTPKEAASIQSFPKEFVFPVSDIQAYKQIGNAIPPVLMWHIANSLIKSI